MFGEKINLNRAVDSKDSGGEIKEKKWENHNKIIGRLNGLEFGAVYELSESTSGVGTLIRALVIGPKDAGKELSLYHLSAKDLDGDTCHIGHHTSDEIWNHPEVKYVFIPKVERPTLFLVDNQELKEPSQVFWEEFIEETEQKKKKISERKEMFPGYSLMDRVKNREEIIRRFKTKDFDNKDLGDYIGDHYDY